MKILSLFIIVSIIYSASGAEVTNFSDFLHAERMSDGNVSSKVIIKDPVASAIDLMDLGEIICWQEIFLDRLSLSENPMDELKKRVGYINGTILDKIGNYQTLESELIALSIAMEMVYTKRFLESKFGLFNIGIRDFQTRSNEIIENIKKEYKNSNLEEGKRLFKELCQILFDDL